MSGSEPTSLGQAIKDAVDNYDIESRKRWAHVQNVLGDALGPEWTTVMVHADNSAQTLIEATGDLVALPRITKTIDSFFDKLSVSHTLEASALKWLVTQRFAINLAWDLAETPDDGAQRIWELLQLVRTFELSNRTRAFLRSISRCYVYGLNRECIVLCRSALEAELESDVSLDKAAAQDVSEVSKQTHRRERLDHSAIRIDLAEKAGRISRESARSAREIMRLGREVQKRPDLPGSAMDAVRSTLTILGELAERHD